MAYPCPHCNQPVRRASSEGVFSQHGLVATLFCSALADFECNRCGKILQEEFPPEAQQQMTRGSYSLVAVGAGLAAAVLVVSALFALMR